MNKITLKHYPASKLPAELRGGIDPNHKVTIVVEDEESEPKKAVDLDAIFSLEGIPRYTREEIVAAIRADRDAWEK